MKNQKGRNWSVRYVLLIAIAVVFSGCGGDDGDDGKTSIATDAPSGGTGEEGSDSVGGSDSNEGNDSSEGSIQAQMIDLASLTTDDGTLQRVHGSAGVGSFGVPVAGDVDCDGDGLQDTAMAAMLANPLGREGAGEVYLVFGTGRIDGTLDTAGMSAGILKIAGDGPAESTGSEIWMDDVTGDGLGDLLIGRQNYSPSPDRIGAGALTIVVGGSGLRDQAARLQYLDLRSPPAAVTLTTIVGAEAFDRLGIWMRTGDITGDGIADIVVGADQAANDGEAHSGAVYIIRGGGHLAVNQTIDLANLGTTRLAGNLARIVPPAGSEDYHFGATCQIADLDGNGRGEVLAAATLSRHGAAISANNAEVGSAHSVGGAPNGALYVAWDDNFTANPWSTGFSFTITSAPASHSVIHGGEVNVRFGEEIVGGLDYDNDGTADLFVGDITGDGTAEQKRPASGLGQVFYTAANLKGREITLDSDPPPDVMISRFLGAHAGDIVSDTSVQGDFDGDGIADLAFSAPHASPLGRSEAGILYVVHGQSTAWPSTVDLAAIPMDSSVRITPVYGAHGTVGTDLGDVLGYSAASGDINDDGRPDLIINEMLGNGLTPAARDTGNLIVISGALFLSP